MKLVSKTKLKGLKNCKLQFYLDINNPELKEYNESTKASFKIGNNFEAKVKGQFPNGYLVKSLKNEYAINETQEALKTNDVLFESAFSSNNLIVRADICLKNEDDHLSFIEIKSGSTLKKEYLLDALIQFWTIKDSGVKINNFEIWNVNKKSKFNQSNVNKHEVITYCLENESIFRNLIKEKDSVLTKEIPQPTYGNHCQNCPFFNHCFKNIQNDPKNVYNLPNFDKKWEALNNKIESIDNPKFYEVYNDYINSNKIVIESLKKNKFLIKKQEVSSFLKKLKYPLNLIDFEAISVSEPVFNNTSPYEVCLVQINHGLLFEDGRYIKNVYLVEEKKQYNKTALTQKLVDFSDTDGSVIVWDNSLELKIMNALKDAVTDDQLKAEIKSLIKNTVDLKQVFDQNIYKPEFLGQMNLKNVASKILLKNIYESSKISHGSQINEEYLKLINKELGFEKIKEDLIHYGENDVQSLKNLIIWLKKAISVN